MMLLLMYLVLHETVLSGLHVSVYNITVYGYKDIPSTATIFVLQHVDGKFVLCHFRDGVDLTNQANFTIKE